MAKHTRPTTTERILDIALKQAGKFARRTLDVRLERAGYARKDVNEIARREGFAKRLAAAAITRFAARSVPGALAAGGALVAGTLLGGGKTAENEPPAPESMEDSGE